MKFVCEIRSKCWHLNKKPKLKKDLNSWKFKSKIKRKLNKLLVKNIWFLELNAKKINDLIVSLKDDPKAQQNLLNLLSSKVSFI